MIAPRLTRDRVTLRWATFADVPYFERWDSDPDVIASTSDDPDAETAFADAVWAEELEAQSEFSRYLVAEVDGKPIGALQVIDPYREPTGYWGAIEPSLRAIDIWIGAAADRSRGYGSVMMSLVIDACFADPSVTGIVIDPLTSNTRAHRFYQRLGFEVVERRLFGEDDCLVHKLTRQAWSDRHSQT